MLLLDEPTNHLDAESVAWLERYLHDFPGTVVAITHDRYFLDNVAGWILELDRGHGIPWEGNYSSWLEQKEKRLEQEERQENARQRAMKAELEWVRSNPKGRHAKSKARLSRFDELSSQEYQKRNETREIYIPPGPRLGDKVIEANGLRKAFGERLLFENLDFSLPPGGIVGVIIPTAPAKRRCSMIAGTEQLTKERSPATLQISVADPPDALGDDKTVWRKFPKARTSSPSASMNTTRLCRTLHFKGTDQQKRIGDLRRRTQLRASACCVAAAVLLLDEPTNDLDVGAAR